MEVKVTSAIRKHAARDRDRETECKRMGSEKMSWKKGHVETQRM